jgi:spore coat protein CotH
MGGTGGDDPVPVDESPELYDPDRLPRFDITLPQASMDALGVDPETYVTGELRYGDEVVSNIGVRIKGEYSKRTLDKKAPFKLKFDEFVPKQTFRGLRRMTFNNMIEDPSFIAERLSYHVYRAAGLPAPRCNSALIYVNGDFFGVYANVETEDKTFLRRWFEDEDGNLYEEGQVDFNHGAETSFDLETNETANDRTDMIAFIDVVENTTPETFMTDMSAVLDMDHFLKFTALEGLVNQWDMYGYTRFYPNNFRFYHDPTSGKFVFIPWGMDMSMKPFEDQQFIAMFEVANNGIADTSGKIFVKCLESTACRTQYAAVVEDMLEVFEGEDLETLAETWFDQIKPDIELDMRKEIGTSYVEQIYADVIAHIQGRGAAVRAELDALP